MKFKWFFIILTELPWNWTRPVWNQGHTCWHCCKLVQERCLFFYTSKARNWSEISAVSGQSSRSVLVSPWQSKHRALEMKNLNVFFYTRTHIVMNFLEWSIFVLFVTAIHKIFIQLTTGPPSRGISQDLFRALWSGTSWCGMASCKVHDFVHNNDWNLLSTIQKLLEDRDCEGHTDRDKDNDLPHNFRRNGRWGAIPKHLGQRKHIFANEKWDFTTLQSIIFFFFANNSQYFLFLLHFWRYKFACGIEQHQGD